MGVLKPGRLLAAGRSGFRFRLLGHPYAALALALASAGMAATLDQGPEMAADSSARASATAARALRDTATLELADQTAKASKRETAATEVKSDFIRKIPSTMNDPVRAASLAPGVTVQNDVNIRPFVRGGDAEQTRVVVNGLPLLQAYHVGGVFSLFNLNTLESVELYKDDFPVEYPGALSGVLRLKNNARFPQKPRMHADLSLLRGDVFTEIPIVKDKFSVWPIKKHSSLNIVINVFIIISHEYN